MISLTDLSLLLFYSLLVPEGLAAAAFLRLALVLVRWTLLDFLIDMVNIE